MGMFQSSRVKLVCCRCRVKRTALESEGLVFFSLFESLTQAQLTKATWWPYWGMTILLLLHPHPTHQSTTREPWDGVQGSLSSHC